jgi:NAD dependent epimerase/dehydratase family enzyme
MNYIHSVEAIQNLNLREPKNIQYKKVAMAIEQDAEEVYKGNEARKKTWTEQNKRSIIQSLVPSVNNVNELIKTSPKGTYIVFPDGSRARF